MHACARAALLLLLLHSLTALISGERGPCGPSGEQAHNGCKILGESCTCGFGCNTEYIYRTHRACMNALRAKNRERNSNICYRSPCIRGTCIQTALDPGYTCKCEGTGYYGQRCERACPTKPMRGLIYPHECIVI